MGKIKEHHHDQIEKDQKIKDFTLMLQDARLTIEMAEAGLRKLGVDPATIE